MSYRDWNRREYVNQLRGYDVALVSSRDRLDPENTGTDNFKLNLYPKDARIRSVSLQFCNLPFNFQNVTLNYGNELVVSVIRFPPINDVHTTTITIPPNWYSISALISYINTAINDWILTFSATISFVISFSSFNGILQITGTDLLSEIRFNPTALPINKRYVYSLLGLYLNQTTSFLGTPGLGNLFPHAASQELPFSYVLIYCDIIPVNLFVSNFFAAHFAIPTANYRALETIYHSGTGSTSHGIIFKEYSDFEQTIYATQTPEKLNRLSIILRDDRGLSLADHVQNQDWSMLLKIEKDYET